MAALSNVLQQLTNQLSNQIDSYKTSMRGGTRGGQNQNQQQFQQLAGNVKVYTGPKQMNILKSFMQVEKVEKTLSTFVRSMV